MQMAPIEMAAATSEEPAPTLEQAFVAHKDLVFRAAYRITGNAGDAEDVLQTVFLRLLKQETPKIRNLPAYLHRSAVNASLDLLRRGKRSAMVAFDDQAPGAEPERLQAATQQPSLEIQQWLRMALARLNPRWAEMFVLRFIEDYSNREIAGMMNTSAAVVAVVLHRTRAQLKKDFKSTPKTRATP
jgi:RNA polymerase sigma-70 factor, ECF subfamily